MLQSAKAADSQKCHVHRQTDREREREGEGETETETETEEVTNHVPSEPYSTICHPEAISGVGVTNRVVTNPTFVALADVQRRRPTLLYQGRDHHVQFLQLHHQLITRGPFQSAAVEILQQFVGELSASDQLVCQEVLQTRLAVCVCRDVLMRSPLVCRDVLQARVVCLDVPIPRLLCQHEAGKRCRSF